MERWEVSRNLPVSSIRVRCGAEFLEKNATRLAASVAVHCLPFVCVSSARQLISRLCLLERSLTMAMMMHTPSSADLTDTDL